MSKKDKKPVGQIVSDLHLRLARAELDRDEWKNQVLCIRAQQRDALKRAEAAENALARIGQTIAIGTGDDLDVAAGRCCPTCRHSLRDHNRDVWNAGYTLGQRHSLSDLGLAWDDGWETAWSPMSPHGRDDGPNPYRFEAGA